MFATENTEEKAFICQEKDSNKIPWYSLCYLHSPPKMSLVSHFPTFQKHPSNPLQNYYPLNSMPLHLPCSLLSKAFSSEMLSTLSLTKITTISEGAEQSGGAGHTIHVWCTWLFTPLKDKLPSVLAREAVWQSYPPEKPSRNSSSSSANDVTERSPPFAQVLQRPGWLPGEVVGNDDLAGETDSGWEALREEWAGWE